MAAPEAAREGLNVGRVVADQLHAHGGPGAVGELELTLLAEEGRRRQPDKRRFARRRLGTDGSLDVLLQTVVVQTEHGRGATDAIGLDQADSQPPKGRRNPAADRWPTAPPSLKAISPPKQIAGQRATLVCRHRDPPKKRT